MRRYFVSRHRLLIGVLIVAALVLLLPMTASAWRGWPHYELTHDAARFLSPDQLQETGQAGYPYISRNADLRVIPELDLDSAWYKDGDPSTEALETRKNWSWLGLNGMKEDDYDLVEWGDPWSPQETWIDCTVTHFWDPGAGGILAPAEGTFGEPYPNSWMKAKILWVGAINAWNAGDTGTAYSYLGHVVHLMQDQGNPAHAHEDWHPIDTNDDSLEAWLSDADDGGALFPDLLFSWTGEYWDGDAGMYRKNGLHAPPGGIMFPAGNDYILAVAADPTRGAVGLPDPDLWAYEHLNMPQLFYLMYTANRYGHFSPSDEWDGAASDPTGWANFSDPLISWTNDEGEALTGAGSTVALEDNDSDPNNNTDGDFTDIMQAGWRTVYRASPALIDVFRNAVDDVPPVTTVDVSRLDGQPVVEWNNSPVIVKLAEATDSGKPGYRVSDVWKRWGECDGETPSFAPDGTPYFTVDGDGDHLVQLMSMDMCGNVEGSDNDFTVKVDLTPPEVTFPNLRPNYLTSGEFIPLWDATDATSGVASEMAYLDGELVEEGVTIDLALKAGRHRLEVWASDVATNMRYEYYDFEVWIDTETDARPIAVNTKTKGAGLMVIIELPAPYDVEAVDLSTCRLGVGATIDLSGDFPVTGALVTLDGELLTGVGDHDADGIPDRMIRFDKEQFAAAVPGLTGDVRSVVWGGLLPDGTPRFIGPVIIPVVTPPR